MSKILFICYIIFLFVIGYWCVSVNDFRQERCVLKYANGKYIKNAVVFTGRRNRRDPYKTNMTGTILMPFGNNVTFASILRLKTGGDFRIEAKACETVRHKWMREYMSQYTNLTLDKCPFPPGTYKFINLELPPKNIPIPLMKGDYFSIMELFITATKEKILEVSTTLRFDPVKNKNEGASINKQTHFSSIIYTN